MDRPLPWLLALSFGASLGAGSYAWLVADPPLAAGIGLFWALGLGLSIRRHAIVGRSRDWQTARWSGAFGGLVTLAMTVGLSPTLPVSPELRLALGLFVGGVALTTMNLGMGAGLEYADEKRDRAPGRPIPRDPAGTSVTGGTRLAGLRVAGVRTRSLPRKFIESNGQITTFLSAPCDASERLPRCRTP